MCAGGTGSGRMRRAMAEGQTVTAAALKRFGPLLESQQDEWPGDHVVIVERTDRSKQEFYGFDGFVLDLTADEIRDFTRDIGQGVLIADLGEAPVPEGAESLRTEVSFYRDGLWGAGWIVRLTKTRGEWLVTQWEMAWIS